MSAWNNNPANGATQVKAQDLIDNLPTDEAEEDLPTEARPNRFEHPRKPQIVMQSGGRRWKLSPGTFEGGEENEKHFRQTVEAALIAIYGKAELKDKDAFDRGVRRVYSDGVIGTVFVDPEMTYNEHSLQVQKISDRSRGRFNQNQNQPYQRQGNFR